MSQALAQSVTQLTPSTPEEIDLVALVQSCAVQAVTGITQERIVLNNSKLMQAVRLKYKAKRTITGKLQDEVENHLQSLVNDYINSQIKRIHQGNSSTLRVYPKADYAHNCIDEITQVLGKNKMPLDWQFAKVTLMLRVTNDRLRKYRELDASGTSHRSYFDLIKAAEVTISKLEVIKLKVKEAMQDGKAAVD